MEVDWEAKNGLTTGEGIALERITVLTKKLQKMSEEEAWLDAPEID
jgi:hypothetical protein